MEDTNILKKFLDSITKYGRNIIGNDGLKRKIENIKICFDSGIQIVHTELQDKNEDVGDHYIKLDYSIDQLISSCSFLADETPIKKVYETQSKLEKKRQDVQAFNSRVQYFKNFLLPRYFQSYNSLLQLRKQELLMIKQRPLEQLIKAGTVTHIDSSDLMIQKRQLQETIEAFKKAKEDLVKAQKEYQEAKNEA